MNITIVTSEYAADGGGLALQCRRFVKMITNLGHQTNVLSSLPKNVISGGYNPSLGMELALEEKLQFDSRNCSNQDLVIAFGGGMNGYYSAQLSKKINKRLWIMYRGSDANLCKWNLSIANMNKCSCHQAETVICLSEEQKNNLIALGVAKSKIHVIPNSATRISDVECNFDNIPIIIGSGASNLNEKKGVVRLIKMVSLYNSRHPERPVNLELVGHIDEDYLNQFQTIAESEKVAQRVFFLGKVDHFSFTNLQKRWNLYIQASVCEGMGNAVTEAISIGTPVLISKTGYIAEMAQKVFPDMLLKSLAPEDMVESFEKILESSEIETKYRQFYELFFAKVTPKLIENKWHHLLSHYKPICSASASPQSILSVSLHDVAGDKHDNITTPVAVFEKFVKDVSDAGYKLCSMANYLEVSEKDRSHFIVCTFDDGYEGLFTNAKSILEKYGFSASVFVCTDYLGKKNSWNLKDKTIRKHMDIDQLRHLQASGWEIGSHGVTHESLLRLSDDELKRQLGDSKRILEGIFGPIRTYAYPYGDYSPFIEKQVKKYYESAFLLMDGGVFLAVDAHRIHRYYISEIYEIIGRK